MPVLGPYLPLDNGPHGMEHISGREVIAFRQLGPPVGLRMPLGLHKPVALRPKLQASRRMDGIIDAAMAGDEAAQQRGIGRVDDGVATQGSDIALPKVNSSLRRLKVRYIGNSFLPGFLLQISVLYCQEFPAGRAGHSDIKQGTKQAPLLCIIRGNVHSHISGLLFEQFFY